MSKPWNSMWWQLDHHSDGCCQAAYMKIYIQSYFLNHFLIFFCFQKHLKALSNEFYFMTSHATILLYGLCLIIKWSPWFAKVLQMIIVDIL